MSIVGWLLLAVFGQQCNIKSQWGIGLPQMCFGIGFILYLDIMIFILNNLPTALEMKGSPGMFLLIAPPSVAVIGLGLFGYSTFAEMLLGWVYVLLVLLMSLGPRIWKAPSVLGEYRAYVFPLAAATNATIQYWASLQTDVTWILTAIMISISIAAMILVFGRMLYHMYQCINKIDCWRDPLFDQEKYRRR